MRRCEKHGRYGCTDYDCQRAETARFTSRPGNDGTLAPGEATARNNTGEPEVVLDEEAR